MDFSDVVHFRHGSGGQVGGWRLSLDHEAYRCTGGWTGPGAFAMLAATP